MGIARNLARLVPNGSGLLPNANIEAVAASKLTGQVPDNNAPSESVIQIVQTVMLSAASYSGSAFNEISPLNTSITPSATSSRILIIPNIDYSAPNGYRTGLRIRRNGTDILLGDASSSRTRASQLGRFFDGSDQMVCQANRMYLDSPSSTSSVTYSFALSLENVTGNSIQINRTVNDADSASHFRGTSTVILMEIRA
jgi:hypothetical protein